MNTYHVYAAAMAGLMLTGALTTAMAEPLNIKPGLWQMTVRGEMHGMPPIPEEQFNSLTPQQRAAIENMMAESAKPHTREMQQCITQEDLNKSENLFNDEQPGMKCSNKLTRHSPTSMSGTIDCTRNGTRASGNFTYEAKDPEHVTGKVSMTITDNTHTMTTVGSMSGHWLGAECPKK